MILKLSSYVNKAVRVSVPSVFKEADPCVCRLAGAEISGLWLEAAELAKRLFPDAEQRTHSIFFVPFTQIAYVVEAPPAAPAEDPHRPHEKQHGRAESPKKRR